METEKSINLQALRSQFAGRKFGELVLEHCSKQDLAHLMAALRGTTNALPEGLRSSVATWIDEIAPLGVHEDFWRRDCGEGFLMLCERARAHIQLFGYESNDDDVFNLFQLALLNMVYTARSNPRSKAFIQKAIGMGFFRRILS